MRTERKNFILRKMHLKFLEHKTCEKKLLTLNQRSLFHIILLLLDQMNLPKPIEKCKNKTIDFSKLR